MFIELWLLIPVVTLVILFGLSMIYIVRSQDSELDRMYEICNAEEINNDHV